MIMVHRGETAHQSGELIDGNYEGLITLSVQPGCVGRYVIDGETGVIASQEIADERFWGAVLATKDESSARARARQGQLWYSSIGYDPAIVPETWWKLYADAGLNHLVDPHDLPTEPIPAALARFDRESMKVAELYGFENGAFPTRRPSCRDAEPSILTMGMSCAWCTATARRRSGCSTRTTSRRDRSPGPAQATSTRRCCCTRAGWLPAPVGVPRPTGCHCDRICSPPSAPCLATYCDSPGSDRRCAAPCRTELTLQ